MGEQASGSDPSGLIASAPKRYSNGCWMYYTQKYIGNVEVVPSFYS